MFFVANPVELFNDVHHVYCYYDTHLRVCRYRGIGRRGLEGLEGLEPPNILAKIIVDTHTAIIEFTLPLICNNPNHKQSSYTCMHFA